MENGLKEFEYTPVNSINTAIKEFTLIKIIKAIERISKSRDMREKTTINRFFNHKNNFEQIRFSLDGEYDDYKPEEIPKSSEYTLEDLEYTFGMEEEWAN